MNHSFHGADKATYRKVLFIGLLGCVIVVAVSFRAKPQPGNHFVVLKADKLVRTTSIVKIESER
jgi:hypothetical protein